MRHFSIKKQGINRQVFIQEIRGQLRRPKLPRIIFWKVNKPVIHVTFELEAAAAAAVVAADVAAD